MAKQNESEKEQYQITERLKLRLLQEYERRLDSEDGLSDTGMANLQRLLTGMGWIIQDEVADSLAGKLTKKIDPKQFDAEDARVIGRIAS